MFQAGNAALSPSSSADAPAEDPQAPPRGRFVLGALNNSNFLMKDHATGSWWSQLDGRCKAGPRTGEALPSLVSVVTTWARWRALFPATRLIDPDPALTGYDYRQPAGGPRYADYLQSERLMGVPAWDARGLHPKTWCVGLRWRAEAICWPYEALEATPMPLHDEVGGLPVVVVYEADVRTAWVYERRLQALDAPLDDAEAPPADLRFVAPGADAPPGTVMVEAGTGSPFDAAGRALGGELAGRALVPAPALEVLWFAWSVFHPHTRLHRSGAA